MLSFYLKCDRIYLHLNSSKEIFNLDKFWELVRRREENEPIEYITNRVNFYSEEFFIAKGALIPRPETEILVDVASSLIQKFNIKKIAEIGVGSGVISIILAKKFPNLKIVATDISKNALQIAEKNLKLHKVDSQIKLLHSSLLDKVEEKVELIVSNPPYISRDFKLSPNIINFEPKEALFADEDGVKLLKEIVLLGIKKEVKAIVCEMGYDQLEKMREFFLPLNPKEFKFYKDLGGLDRGFWLIP